MSEYDLASKLKTDNRELEQAKFLVSAISRIALRVGNEEESPLFVTLSKPPRAVDFYHYDDVSAVLHNVYTKVSELIVPPGKILDLYKITASGSNVAKYTVQINGNINKVQRTYFGASLNCIFEYNKYRLMEGDKIEVYAVHYNDMDTAEIEATIEGALS